MNLITQKSLCENCLKAGHKINYCWSRQRCRHDGKKHHTLVCNENRAATVNACDVTEQTGSRITDFHVNNASSDTVRDVNFQLLSLHAFNDFTGKRKDVTVCMDGASNVTLCTQSFYDALELSGIPTNVRMKTVDGSEHDIESVKTSFTLKGPFNPTTSRTFTNVLVVPTLPDVRIKGGKSNAKFDGVPEFPTLSGVEVLIGACDADMHIMLEVKQAINKHLYAIRLPLGWTRFGCNSHSGTDLPSYSSNCATVNCTKVTNNDLHNQMEKVFNFDFNDAQDSGKNSTSTNDDLAVGMVKSSIGGF